VFTFIFALKVISGIQNLSFANLSWGRIDSWINLQLTEKISFKFDFNLSLEHERECL